MFGLRYLSNVATLKLDAERCTGCRMCTVVCPHHVFEINNKIAHIADLNACMECGACELNCPADAISVHAGVGCASAILKSRVTGGEVSCDCCCTNDPNEISCC